VLDQMLNASHDSSTGAYKGVTAEGVGNSFALDSVFLRCEGQRN
jgi:hypothetical protein